MSGWLWGKPKPKNFEEVLQKEAEEAKASDMMPDNNQGDAPTTSRVQVQQSPPPPREVRFSGFDATAYERAAKAMKEIDKSKNAKEALELTLKQEETKKAEMEANKKQIELQLQQENTNRARVMEEEKRKTLKDQQRFNQQNEQYKDRLARKRHDDQLDQDKRNNEEIMRRQEESVKQQEMMRRETVEYQEKLRHENEMKSIEAKMRGKAKVERDNHDLNKEKIKLESKEKRRTILEAVSSVGNMIGTGIDTLISNKEKAMGAGGAMLALAGGFFIAKHGTVTVARFIENRLGKPTLVRETSRANYKDVFKHPITTAVRMWQGRNGLDQALKGVVTSHSLDSRLKVLVASTFFTKQNGGTYRNLLMYGPPGTGKTLFAKKLATSSGMDYAIITGGDIAPMGKEGVTALHKVFDWGATSKKGLILFVDEADAFLRKRTETQMSEDMRSCLNAFLYRTGESSKSMMLVMASNRPDHLDWAINDRLDEMVEFPLPGLEEREQLLQLYYKIYVADLAEKGDIQIEEFDSDSVLSDIAARSEGFSGREISKLGIALQASAYASPDKTFRPEMLLERLAESLAANKQKSVWKKHEGIEGLVGT